MSAGLKAGNYKECERDVECCSFFSPAPETRRTRETLKQVGLFGTLILCEF